jgi:hypothetical protein
MYTQLVFYLALRNQGEQKSIIQNEGWLDVSDIARGVGFTSVVRVSNGLQEALQAGQNEIGGDYNQRLYDALWLSHFKLSLDPGQSVTFNFTFPRKEGTAEKVSEIRLRLRVEVEKQTVWLGLMEDFRNEKWILF